VKRNPNIAQMMYYCKDIESFGTGLQRIVRACEEAGIKVAFKQMSLGFSVIFYRPKNHINVDVIRSDDRINDPINDLLNDPLNKTQNAIIAALRQNKTATYEVLATAVGVSTATIKRHLKRLQELGMIERVGSKKDGHWIVKQPE